MDYEGIVIRPPSEARSLILQATFGCSHNKCTFCPTYKGSRFRIKEQERLFAEIDEAASWGPIFRKVFLADGDGLIIPTQRLAAILEKINERMPWIERVGIYGNTKSVLRKTVLELKELAGLGLKIVYLGLESGDPKVLEGVKKGVTVEQMIEASKRIKDAGMQISVTALLGIAGVEGSERHAQLTGEALTNMDPNYAACLTVMVVPNTELYESRENGEFVLPDRFGLLQELAVILRHTNMTSGMFMANHASNYLPLRIMMPNGKKEAIELLEKVVRQRDERMLKPEWLRAL